jgi:transposase
MRQVADVIGVCYESVRRWVSWYRSGGLDEVRARRNGRSGGLPPRLSDEQHEQLKQRARQGELRTIHDGVRWAREEAGVEYT